jgi:hypothetical protein
MPSPIPNAMGYRITSNQAYSRKSSRE